jgi:soluble lytic murein transglycosylase-like protein
MHVNRRPTPPPWERSVAYARHPTGRARRRWPRAYDGGTRSEGPTNRRYASDFDQDRRRERRRSSRRSMMDSIRQNPLRHGLIGLAVAGTAAPIAVNQYQQAMRTDPSHETAVARNAGQGAISDQAVSQAWNAMETGRSAAAGARESMIQGKMSEYAEFGLTRDLAEDIYDLAATAEIDPDVAFGLVRAESSFKNSSTSRVGAMGLTQLMPNTATWLEPGVTRSELRDPETNLRIGFKYLRQLIDKYEGNEDLALLAYNRGPGTVDRILKRGGNPDNGYADFVRTGDIGSHKG